MFYTRLKTAIREQNWFAVVLEILIVVLGVVIGFQISAWSQTQSDLTTERTYLNQISADLSRTQGQMVLIDRTVAESEEAARQLFDSFRKIDPVPDDSMLVLISTAYLIYDLSPVLGTMEALINTGDLGLIRNDSLRLAIPSNLEVQRSLDAAQDMVRDELLGSFRTLAQFVDIAEANAAVTRAGGTIAVPSPRVNASDPRYSTAAPFPFSAADFNDSFEAYSAVRSIHHWKIQAKMLRASIAEVADELEVMISAELSR